MRVMDWMQTVRYGENSICLHLHNIVSHKEKFGAASYVPRANIQQDLIAKKIASLGYSMSLSELHMACTFCSDGHNILYVMSGWDQTIK